MKTVNIKDATIICFHNMDLENLDVEVGSTVIKNKLTTILL